MKRNSWFSPGSAFWLTLLLVLPAPRAFAVAGVADTTVIVGDMTDMWKWPRELAQWTTMIENTTQQINRADELIRIVGDPEKVVHELIGSIPDLMQPTENVINLETRQQALNLSNSIYGLGKTASKTYNDANKVDDNYKAFGETVKRDPKRYMHYAMQEGMYARYQKAVSNEEKVEKKEVETQRVALQKLQGAHTEAEVAVFTAQITASKQRQDLAHQKALQVKAELDAFRGQLAVEDARKAEADREWAQGVVERMRTKALDAYKAQIGAGRTTDEN